MEQVGESKEARAIPSPPASRQWLTAPNGSRLGVLRREMLNATYTKEWGEEASGLWAWVLQRGKERAQFILLS